MVIPGSLRATAEDKISAFFFRLKYDELSGYLSGICVGVQETLEDKEHGELFGELIENNKLKIEVRYSKFYFYPDQMEKEMIALENNIISTYTFNGKLTENKMMFGRWEIEPKLFEYEGRVRKTLPWHGTWWAKKML